MIRSDQISKKFRSGHDCTNTSSSSSPCYVGLQAHFTIWICRKVLKHTVLGRTRFHVLAAPLEDHKMTWKCLDFFALGLEMCGLLCIRTPRCPSEVLSSTKFSLNSSGQSGNSCENLFVLLWILNFNFDFRFLWNHATGLPEAVHSYPLFLSDTGASTSVFRC